MKVYIATVNSIHNGIEENNIIAASLNYNLVLNAMNTDYLDTIHNLYDFQGIDYNTSQEDDIYTVRQNAEIYEHYDQWYIKEVEMLE